MKKILVVDDEKPISDIVKFNLNKEGYEVFTAYDGEEALEKVEEVNPDLIILDLESLSVIISEFPKLFFSKN